MKRTSPQRLTRVVVLSLLFSFLVALSAFAQTADDYYQAGVTAWENQDLVAANSNFQSALNLSPAHQGANFYYALTRLLMISQSADFNTLLDRAGVSANGRNLINWTADFTRDAYGKVLLPPTCPSGSEIQAFLKNNILPQINGSLNNLSQITSNFTLTYKWIEETGNGVLTNTTTFTDTSKSWRTNEWVGYKIMLEGIEHSITANTQNTLTLSPAHTFTASTLSYKIYENVKIDYGDVLVLRGMANLGKIGIYILSAYNVNVDIPTMVSVFNSITGDLQIHLVSAYTDLLKLLPDQQLSSAKAAIKEAINLFNAAVDIISAETDPQNKSLFVIDNPNDVQKYKNILADINSSLDKPTLIGEINRNVNLSEFFDYPKNLRDYLPVFHGKQYVQRGTFPDSTFGNILPTMTPGDLENLLAAYVIDDYWPLRDSGTTGSFNNIAFGNGVFVAVDYSGLIETSGDNGATWVSRSSGTTNYLTGAAYGNGTFVVVGYSGTVRTSSDNGATWVARSSGTTNPLYGIAYGNGIFIATSYNGIYKSTDFGVTWVFQSITSYTSSYGIAHGNGTFAMVTSGGKILISTDNGANWTTQYSGSMYLSNITFGNGVFVAVGNSGILLVSTDNGLNWNPKTSGTTNYLTGIVYGNGTFIANGSSYGSTAQLIVSTDNGQTWSTRVLGDPNLYKIGFGNGTFVGVGNKGTTVQSNGTLAPGAVTNNATNITTVSAQLNASVNPNGFDTVYYFQWGTTTAYGKNTAPLSAGNGLTSQNRLVALSGLAPSQLYHFRVVAYNNQGTSFGSDLSFTTSGDTTPPSLAITSHSNGQQVNTATITLAGTASDAGKGDNGIASVTVNGSPVDNGGTATGSGTANWSKQVTLNPGANSITVIASDNSPNHNPATQSITLYGPPSPTLDATLSILLNGAAFANLKFGMAQGATDNFDNSLDQVAPPASPDGDDAYFASISGQGSPYDRLIWDYRGISTQATWKLVVKVAAVKSMSLGWNSLNLPTGWYVTYQEANSSWVGTGTVNLISYSCSDPALILDNTAGGDLVTKRYLVRAYQGFPLSLKAGGWNLISLPIDPANTNPDTAFGANKIAVYCWDAVGKRYVVPTTIQSKMGCWVAVSQDTDLQISGIIPVNTHVHLLAGWNLVGPVCTQPVPTVSPVLATYGWGWPPNYQYILPTSCEVGKGYWVAAGQEGDIW